MALLDAGDLSLREQLRLELVGRQDGHVAQHLRAVHRHQLLEKKAGVSFSLVVTRLELGPQHKKIFFARLVENKGDPNKAKQTKMEANSGEG